MRVVGLDLATTLGWAAGAAGGIPRLGAFTLPSTREDIGRYLVAYEDWLTAFLDLERPDHGFFEAPILSQHTMTARKLMCLAGVTESIFVRRGIAIREVNISSAKLYFAGHGRAEKPAMVAAALKRGMPVGDCAKCRGLTVNTRGRPCAFCEGTGKDHNQADAGAVWAFGCASLRGRAGEAQRAILRSFDGAAMIEVAPHRYVNQAVAAALKLSARHEGAGGEGKVRPDRATFRRKILMGSCCGRIRHESDFCKALRILIDRALLL